MPEERLSVRIGNEDIVFSTGKVARQADGAVWTQYGGTVVLNAVCVAPEARPGLDFFPLTVDYREKSYAAGRIPGNFFRREGRPSEREILICRVTDRPIRPLFPKGFRNEVQVSSNVYSADNVNDPGVLSINAASAALHISKIPFNGPVGAVRIGMFDGEIVVNPPMERMEESQIDLIIAGTHDAICMVEGAAEEVSEDDMIRALEIGHESIKKICACLDELRERAGVEKMEFSPPEPADNIVADVEAFAAERLAEALKVSDKLARQDAIRAIKDELKTSLAERYGEEAFAEAEADIGVAFQALEKRVMRGQVIATSTRIDGRGLDEVRPITIEVGVLPRTHGSCLFTRGETQAVVTATLGTSRDEQRLDELTGEEFKRFMLHYNFPPWSVGETRPIRGPGRREIGHGRLAERALEPVLPHGEDDDFPYTLRVVSDVTESNGSSSMASVCGGALSLMDAGVPVTAPVAGIAMGLIKEGDEVRILTDILGDEDHLGDMDFKVTGTRKGITAFQMDVKVAGITQEIMRNALRQAHEGRLHVLSKMEEVLPAARPDVSPLAPRIHTIHIDPDKIRDVIGPGGKVIRHIQAETGADIDIEDDGTVKVAAVDKESADAAIEMIKHITADVEVGEIYRGTVSRLMNFGAFVSVLGGKEGLVHISELAPGHVREVRDVVDVGDELDVKVIEIDKMGRVNMSKVQADQELGRLTEEETKEMESGGDRDRRSGGDRGGDRGGSRGGGRDRRGGGDRGGSRGGGRDRR